MRKLFKKLLRDIISSKGQFISIILVIATGVGFFAGLFIFMGSLTRNLDSFYQQTNMANVWAVYGGIDQNGIDRIKQINGVTDAQGRLMLDGVSANSSSSKEFIVYTLPTINSQDMTINTPQLTDGTLPTSPDECILCQPTAQANGIKTGDTLDVSLGGKDYNLKVSGLFLSPEYVFQVKDASVAIPDYKNFGVIFLPASMAGALEGNSTADSNPVTYNQVSITLKPGTDPQSVITALASVTKDYQYGYAYARDKQLSYSIIDYKIQSIKKIALVFPIIFFLVAAALISISMSRLVASQRGQIGIMKALGSRRRTITLHYLSYAVITGLLGGLIGSIVGTTLLPGVIINVVTAYFSLPPIVLYGGVQYALIGTVLAILFGVAAAFFSCRRILKQSAAQLMRPQPPKNAKKIWFEKRPALWAHLSYRTKLILRNIFLNKRRAALGTLGIIAGCALIFASLALQGTYSYCMDDYLNNRNNYDLQVVLDKPDDSFSQTISTLGTPTQTAQLSGILSKDNQQIEVMVTAIPSDTQAVRLFNANHTQIFAPQEGVLVTQKFAQLHDINVGDSLDIRLISAAGVTQVSQKVAGICVSYFGQGIFISFDALSKLGITPPVTTYYVNLSGAAPTSEAIDTASITPINSAADAAGATSTSASDNSADSTASSSSGPATVSSASLAAAVSTTQSMDGVKAVYTKADVQEFMASAQDLISTIIVVMVIASAILTLAVIFNLTSINIFDRRRDIATLRVLGYHHKEVQRLILQENLLLTAFGAIVGTGLGFLTQYALISFIGTNDTSFPYLPIWWCIPVAIGSVFIFTLIVNLLSRRKIRRIDMVESLKSVE